MTNKGLESIGEILSRGNIQSRNLPTLGKDNGEVFKCPACRDAGWIHPRDGEDRVDYSKVWPCDCQLARIEQGRNIALMAECELPGKTEDLIFENFERVQGAASAIDAVSSLARGGKGAWKWVTIIAPPDRGKTHLAIAACRQWLKRGVPAFYAQVALLLDELRRGYNDNSFDKRFSFFCNVPLLVLDDLGVEHSTSWVNERLDTIVDYRAIRELPLIITTNKLASELSPRIASRVQRVTFGKVVTISAGEYHLRRDRGKR